MLTQRIIIRSIEFCDIKEYNIELIDWWFSNFNNNLFLQLYITLISWSESMSLFKNTCYQDVQSTDLLPSQIYKIKLYLFFKFEKDWEVKENILKSHNLEKT